MIVFNGRAFAFSHGDNFLMNRPLVFYVRGSFRDIWCLDFWLSVDSDSCVCAHLDFWSKNARNCWSLEIPASLMTLEF